MSELSAGTWKASQAIVGGAHAGVDGFVAHASLPRRR
jgi:hypothetical protein